MTFENFCNIIKEELSLFCSIESIDIIDKEIGRVEINLEVHELNYVADVLSIGKINEYLYDRLNAIMPVGISIDLNLNMISPLDEVIVVKL